MAVAASALDAPPGWALPGCLTCALLLLPHLPAGGAHVCCLRSVPRYAARQGRPCRHASRHQGPDRSGLGEKVLPLLLLSLHCCGVMARHVYDERTCPCCS